jgi:hypothetical protein
MAPEDSAARPSSKHAEPTTFIERDRRPSAERPEAVATYREAVATFLADGVVEDWEQAELQALRDELGISLQTHIAIISELQKNASPVAAFVDSSAMADFVIGGQCMIRVKVVNEGQRPLKRVSLFYATTAQEVLCEQASGLLGPGRDTLLSAAFIPDIHGHHEFQGALATTSMSGEASHFLLRPIHFRVASESVGPQQVAVNIDASSMRVGSFDNLNAAVSKGASGRMLRDADWIRVELNCCKVEDWEDWVMRRRKQRAKPSAVPPPPPQPPAPPPRQVAPVPPPPRPAPPAVPQATKQTISVGRELDNAVVLNSAQVSRFHAIVEYDGVRVVLVDRGSSNGTFVNGKRISSPTIIWPADVIGFGSYTTTGEVFWSRFR